MYIDVVCDVHICMAQQSRENFHIHPFVIAIRRKSVSEHMLSPVRNTRSLAQALRLVSQGFILGFGMPPLFDYCAAHKIKKYPEGEVF